MKLKALLGFGLIGQSVALAGPRRAPFTQAVPLASRSQVATPSCYCRELALHARQRNPAVPPPLPPPHKQKQAGFPPTCNFYLSLTVTATLSRHLLIYSCTTFLSPYHALWPATRALPSPSPYPKNDSIATKGATVLLRRHERNLRSRSRTFRSPLEVVFRSPHTELDRKG